jgi:hypothetical protein
MYTYEVSKTPPLAKIFYDEKVVDVVGPWDSEESAQTWAESYTNKLNLGIE